MKVSELSCIKELLAIRTKKFADLETLADRQVAAVELVNPAGNHFVISSTQPAAQAPMTPAVNKAVLEAVKSALTDDIASLEQTLKDAGVTEFDDETKSDE